MPNLSWMEMLVVGIVALIVIGPKDLPGLFRQVGQFVGKAKGMAREFSSAMNAAADEAGVSEINKTIKAAANPQKFGADKIREATKIRAADTFKETQGKGGSTKAQTETDKLRATMTEDRKATAQKMNDAMAKAATDRKAAEVAEAAPKTAPKTTKAAASKAKTKPKAPVKPKAAAKPKAAPKAKPKAKSAAKDKT